MDDPQYASLTDEQKKKICNGCGAAGSWFRPIHWFNITPCCDAHDADYFFGFGTRKEADAALRRCILSKGRGLRWYNPKAWYYWAWSWIVWVGVRLGGRKSWRA